MPPPRLEIGGEPRKRSVASRIKLATVRVLTSPRGDGRRRSSSAPPEFVPQQNQGACEEEPCMLSDDVRAPDLATTCDVSSSSKHSRCENILGNNSLTSDNTAENVSQTGSPFSRRVEADNPAMDMKLPIPVPKGACPIEGLQNECLEDDMLIHIVDGGSTCSTSLPPLREWKRGRLTCLENGSVLSVSNLQSPTLAGHEIKFLLKEANVRVFTDGMLSTGNCFSISGGYVQKDDVIHCNQNGQVSLYVCCETATKLDIWIRRIFCWDTRAEFGDIETSDMEGLRSAFSTNNTRESLPNDVEFNIHPAQILGSDSGNLNSMSSKSSIGCESLPKSFRAGVAKASALTDELRRLRDYEMLTPPSVSLEAFCSHDSALLLSNDILRASSLKQSVSRVHDLLARPVADEQSAESPKDIESEDQFRLPEVVAHPLGGQPISVSSQLAPGRCGADEAGRPRFESDCTLVQEKAQTQSQGFPLASAPRPLVLTPRALARVGLAAAKPIALTPAALAKAGRAATKPITAQSNHMTNMMKTGAESVKNAHNAAALYMKSGAQNVFNSQKYTELVKNGKLGVLNPQLYAELVRSGAQTVLKPTSTYAGMVKSGAALINPVLALGDFEGRKQRRDSKRTRKAGEMSSNSTTSTEHISLHSPEVAVISATLETVCHGRADLSIVYFAIDLVAKFRHQLSLVFLFVLLVTSVVAGSVGYSYWTPAVISMAQKHAENLLILPEESYRRTSCFTIFAFNALAYSYGFYFGMDLLLPAAISAWWQYSWSRDQGRVDLGEMIRSRALQGKTKKYPDIMLPDWVNFPDVERAEWLNRVLERWWPYLKVAIRNSVMQSLNPLLRSNKPGFLSDMAFSNIELGDSHPHVSGVQVLDTEQSEGRFIVDIELRYAAAPNQLAQVSLVTVMGVAANIILTDLVAVGTLRLVFDPLTGEWPCFDAISVSFVRKPLIDFRLTAAKLHVTGMPIIATWLQGFLRDTLSEHVVWPRAATVSLASEQKNSDKTSQGSAAPSDQIQGLLEVSLSDLSDRSAADTDRLPVVCSMQLSGDSTLYSFSYESHPIHFKHYGDWRDSCTFLVGCPTSQSLIVCLESIQRNGETQTIGSSMLPLGNLATTDLTKQVKFGDCRDHSLNIKFMWHPFANSKENGTTEDAEAEKIPINAVSSKANSTARSGVLLFRVHELRLEKEGVANLDCTFLQPGGDSRTIHLLTPSATWNIYQKERYVTWLYVRDVRRDVIEVYFRHGDASASIIGTSKFKVRVCPRPMEGKVEQMITVRCEGIEMVLSHSWKFCRETQVPKEAKRNPNNVRDMFASGNK